MKKRRKLFLIPLILCLSMLFSAGSVFAAEMTESELEIVNLSIDSFLKNVLSMTDEQLEEMSSYDDVYADVAEKVREARKDTGALIDIKSVTSEIGEHAVTATAQCDFEKLDAEVVVYLTTDATEITNMVINVDYPLSTKMGQAVSNFAIGVIIVFVILLFLAFIISLFKYLNPDARKKKAAQKKAAQSGQERPAGVKTAEVNAQAQAAVQQPAAAANAAEQKDDLEIVAVIAAAIAAAEADLGPSSGDGYVVRSIRKLSGNWKRA